MSGDKQLVRRSSSMAIKEKIIKYYETVLLPSDPSHSNQNFWNEFFLIKANADGLETQILGLKPGDLMAAKSNINELFSRCIKCLKGNNTITTVNAMQTMCGLVKGTFGFSRGDCGFEVIDLLVGFDNAEAVMQELIENIHSILISTNSPVSMKNMCLRFLLTVVTVTDNISQNTLLEYLMINNIFESLVLILTEPALRARHGSDAVVLLMMLVQYRKYESTNPYVVNLSILDNDLALNGLSQIIALSLLGYNRQYTFKLTQQKSTGFVSSITSMVGSMFSTSDDIVKIKLKPDVPLLLALYEAVHLNRNFVLALTTSHASSGFGSGVLSTEDSVEAPAIPCANEVPVTSGVQDLDQPTNLLAVFIEYTSIILHDIRDTENLSVCKLCFIILRCVAEDQYACSLMHDPNINFRVPIHRLPMRHRKIQNDAGAPNMPLASSTIELQVEFIVSHMMKTLPAELYLQSLGIIHRLIVYQKKSRVRLNYPWKQLWAALTNLIKFILANESPLLKLCNIFLIAHKVVSIFNLFITYGDMFLAAPNSYDELYYELIRTHSVFDNLYTMTLRYTSSEKWKEDAAALIVGLGNIRLVVNHFQPKVESWAAVNHLSSLTEEQVLEVVRSNYDTLTLKVQDNLDQYERYSEKPKHTSFFLNLLRGIVHSVRGKATIGKLEQASLLREFSALQRP